jgi:aconitase A
VVDRRDHLVHQHVEPGVMVGAGLLARKAVAKGLTVKPWVKTSLRPGSQVVAEYLDKSGLQKDLDKLGYNLIGFGCTTCIGNSGPLAPEISKTINDQDLVAGGGALRQSATFEGRVNADVRANYLASPPLVVAYALAGSMYSICSSSRSASTRRARRSSSRTSGRPSREISSVVRKTINKQMFSTKYADVFKGDSHWRAIKVKGGLDLRLGQEVDLRAEPALFRRHGPPSGAAHRHRRRRVLCLLLDSITTDHISPAGSIKIDSPAGKYLIEHKVKPLDFNQYGTRRGNHEVMMRGTFANIPLKNQMVPGVEGGVTVPLSVTPAHVDLRRRHALQDDKVPLVIFAGKEYGSGSSRDWAAKGTESARRACRHHPVVRAHSSLQPHRHGRAAALLRGGHVLADARAQGRRAGDDPGPARRDQTAAAHDGRDRRLRWRPQAHPAHVPHRYAGRARLLQARRHLALCAAASGGGIEHDPQEQGGACSRFNLIGTRSGGSQLTSK